MDTVSGHGAARHEHTLARIHRTQNAEHARWSLAKLWVRVDCRSFTFTSFRGAARGAVSSSLSSFAGTAECGLATARASTGLKARGCRACQCAGRWRACVVEDGKARPGEAELGRDAWADAGAGWRSCAHLTVTPRGSRTGCTAQCAGAGRPSPAPALASRPVRYAHG